MFIQAVFTLVFIIAIFFLVYLPFNYFFPGSEEEQILERKREELNKAKLLVKSVEKEEKIRIELSKVNERLKKLKQKRRRNE